MGSHESLSLPHRFKPPHPSLSLPGRLTICLEIHINHFAILIDGPPQLVLLAIDLNGPAHRRRLHQCKTCRHNHSDASFGEQVFNIAVAEIESVVEPESLPHEVLWVRRRK